MAQLNILNSAQLFQPAFNPIWYRIIDSAYTQSNFTFNVIVSGVSTYASTTANTTNSYNIFKPMPDPTTGITAFSPSEVLKYDLNFDHTQNTIGCAPNSGSIEQYYVYWGDEYGPTSNIMTYSGLTQSSGYTWNGVLQYEEVPGFNYTAFILSGTSGRFLTNAPKTQLIRNNERASLGFLNYITTGNKFPQNIRLTTYQSSGGSKTAYIMNTNFTGATKPQTTDYLLQYVGVGPWNLNQVPNNQLSALGVNTQPIFNINTDYKYEITACSGTTPCSETLTYLIDNNCSRYAVKRLMFQGRQGPAEFFTFTLLSNQYYNLSKTEFKKPLAWNYDISARQNTTINTKSAKGCTVNSDWLNDDYGTWLRELVHSPNVFEVQDDGSLLPIIITATHFDEQNQINTQIFNLTLDYIYSFDINTQNN